MCFYCFSWLLFYLNLKIRKIKTKNKIKKKDKLLKKKKIFTKETTTENILADIQKTQNLKPCI